MNDLKQTLANERRSPTPNLALIRAIIAADAAFAELRDCVIDLSRCSAAQQDRAMPELLRLQRHVLTLYRSAQDHCERRAA